MKLTLRGNVTVYVGLYHRAVVWTRLQHLPEAIRSEVTNEAACREWASWIPPRTDAAVVMQVVSKDYVDLQRNFIRLIELNSAFTRQHIFLMCLDNASVSLLASWGIRRVPLATLNLHTHKDVWKTRVRVLRCLVKEGYDVILSDSDALWLGDPMEYIDLSSSSSSSVIASRGGYLRKIGSEWGSTMCVGFAMFRATGAALDTFQDAIQRIVLGIGDDQIALNQAALELGIVWNEGSDIRYGKRTGFGKGAITGLSGDDGESFEVTLLPHNKFTRHCAGTPITNETVVVHCFHRKAARAKTSWMQQLDLWSPHGIRS